MTIANKDDRAVFEQIIRSLEVETANIGTHLLIDAEARLAYIRQISAMANELRMEASRGKITWGQAADLAQETRNTIMELIRNRSTPVGLAIAQKLKSKGKTLNELVARKVQQIHGPSAAFDRLSETQKNQVYGEIVKSAGQSNPKVSALMRKLSRAGRGLVFLSIALSVYTVATADDKLDAVGKELVITGSGIGGGIAGGALAGLACGPGAPVCVTVGAFVGGALAAFGVSFFW